ncbi:MAG: helix-turn-helix domain-containing protein [Clostridia bacterium]|nr:helix-turn-helix domain-containing protein [Clostridia bacterium]
MFAGKKIRDFRKKRGLTLVELSEKLAVSPSYLSSIERNIKKPSLPILKKISECLNISMSNLYEDTMEGSTGEKIRNIREGRGLTIEELSEISNIPTETILKLEKDVLQPDLEQMESLSEALNVTINFFLERNNSLRSIGKRLRQVREKQGLTITALADKARVSPGLISQIENTQTIPLLDTLENIANSLGSPLNYFLVENEDVENLLQSMGTEMIQLLGDSQVQTVLRAILDMDQSEVNFILNFIQFFRKQRKELK